MANFTKISPYRAGPPRFGRAPGEEPANGPVITYRLSPEEIARRYGPPVAVERRPRLTRELLAEMLRTKTVGQVAARYQVPQKLITDMVEQYGLELDENNRLTGGDDVAVGDKIRAAREALPREEFEKLVRQGMTDKEVAEAKNLDLHLVKKLKQQYGLTGIVGRRNHHIVRKERENMAFETYPSGAPDNNQERVSPAGKVMTIAQAVQTREEMLEEMACAEQLLAPDANLTAGVRDVIQRHFNQCREMVERIERAFEREIEI